MDDYWYDHRQNPDRFLSNGRWCKCEECGKTFFVSQPGEWVYKLQYQKMGKKVNTKFFHTWSCYHKHKLQHEKELEEVRRSAAFRGAATHKARLAERLKGKKCDDCRFFQLQPDGFCYCTMRCLPVRHGKNACSKFKEPPKEE